jgi:hypothetical protein
LSEHGVTPSSGIEAAEAQALSAGMMLLNAREGVNLAAGGVRDLRVASYLE